MIRSRNDIVVCIRGSNKCTIYYVKGIHKEPYCGTENPIQNFINNFKTKQETCSVFSITRFSFYSFFIQVFYWRFREKINAVNNTEDNCVF